MTFQTFPGSVRTLLATKVQTLRNTYKSSTVAEMGDRGHNRYGPKKGGGVLGPRLVQCGLSRGLLPYQAALSSIQPFGHNRHRPKIGWEWVCPFFWGVAGFISNTMSRRPRPAEAYLHTKWHLDPSSRLSGRGDWFSI